MNDNEYIHNRLSKVVYLGMCCHNEGLEGIKNVVLSSVHKDVRFSARFDIQFVIENKGFKSALRHKLNQYTF